MGAWQTDTCELLCIDFDFLVNKAVTLKYVVSGKLNVSNNLMKKIILATNT